jgi:uncharacterized protein YqjF (DUF2071 family)
MHPAFARLDHRPWPVPDRPWAWRQSWLDLLFAHWPVPAAVLRPLVPPPLKVQEFGGTSWVGVVPFRMRGVMRRPFPSLPWISAFPELNLRLYVEHGDKPGVWFLSLDAANPLAVWAARRWFHLPYFHADMSVAEDQGRFRYRSMRRGVNRTEFAAEYGPTAPPAETQPGSIEHWLVERYCLYAQSPGGTLYRGEIHHQPWSIQSAEAKIDVNDLGRPFEIALDGPPTFLHFSKRIDVVVWPLERLTERCKAKKTPALAARPALRPA